MLSSQADDFSLMQEFSYPTPRSHNVMDAPPWYPFETVPEGQNDLSDEEDHEDFREDTSDEPSEDDEPDEDPERSRMTANLQSSFICRTIPCMLCCTGMIMEHYGAMMQEIAYHFGIGRVDVLDCHELVVRPWDIPEGATPLIIQQVQNIPVGEMSVLILIDIELHGQHMEAHYHQT